MSLHSAHCSAHTHSHCTLLTATEGPDIVGLVLLLAYAIGMGLWPVYAPGLMELGCIMWLTWLKVVTNLESTCLELTNGFDSGTRTLPLNQKTKRQKKQ